MIFLSILLILTYHHHQTVFCLSRLKKQLDIDHLHIQIIGKLIWLNECNGSKEGLVSWNKGEKFASLGIGHFTWYPQHSSCFSKETFPSLLLFLKKQGISLNNAGTYFHAVLISIELIFQTRLSKIDRVLTNHVCQTKGKS